MGSRACAGDGRGLGRSRWAAIGAAVAVTFGAGGLFAANAASPDSSTIAIEPVRILDTRDPVDVGLGGPFVSPAPQDLKVTGSVPTTSGNKTVVPAGATGVFLNVTPVGSTAAGFISVRPADAAGLPATSNVNLTTGAINPNAVLVELPVGGADDGQIEITFDAFGAAGPTSDVLVDIVGYTTDAKLNALDARLAAVEATIAAVEAKVAPLVNGAAAFSGGDQLVGLTTTAVIVRSVSITPPANGTILVTSSATNNLEVRCSITEGGDSMDFSYLQIQTAVPGGFGTLAATRGFTVTEGVPFTVNLVCDGTTGAYLLDSSLTAIFAPS